MSRPDRCERIMVAQLARFGDFLQTTPLLKALKTNHPGTKLTVMVSPEQAALAKSNPDVDDVIPVDLRALQALALNRNAEQNGFLLVRQAHNQLKHLTQMEFDWVLNLNTSLPAALLCELPQATRRAGPALGLDRQNLIPSNWAPLIMHLMRQRRLGRFNLVDLLASYADLEQAPPRGLTYVLPSDSGPRAEEILGRPKQNRPLIGLQMGSRHISRQWPPEYFAALARRLMDEEGASVVLLGTKAEKHIGRAFFEHLSLSAPRLESRVIDLMGQTTLDELAGVVSRLDLLVTTDTGTMHLAAALDIPILALFMGPALCHETGPYGRGHLIIQASPDCSPCTEGNSPCDGYPCRHAIQPGLVMNGALRLLHGSGFQSDSSQVEVLVSDFDDFGVVYRPIAPRPAEYLDLLALCYREAGRRFIRPAYPGLFTKFFQEIDTCYLDVGPVAEEVAARFREAPNTSVDPAGGLSPMIGLMEELRGRGRPDAADSFYSDMIGYAGALVSGRQDQGKPALAGGKTRSFLFK